MTSAVRSRARLGGCWRRRRGGPASGTGHGRGDPPAGSNHKVSIARVGGNAMRVDGWERQEPAEQIPPDSPAVDDGRGSVFRSEEFCLDEVDEPVLPLRFGPAGADDQELERAA